MKLLIIFLFILAAFAKAIGDSIGWRDLWAKIWFFSRTNTGTKDKNLDGKISFFETYFPWDGWHLTEWLRIIPFALAVSLITVLRWPTPQFYYWVHINYWWDIFIQMNFTSTGLPPINYWLDLLIQTLELTVIYNFTFLIAYALLPETSEQ